MPVYSTPDEYSNGYTPGGSVLPKPEGFDYALPAGKNPEPSEPVRKLNIVDALAPTPKFAEVKSYNPYTVKGELAGYESFATNFVDSRSPQETEAIKLQINARKSVFGVESAGEFKMLMTTSTAVTIVLVLLVSLLYRKLSR